MNSVNVNGQFDRYSVTVCGYGYLGDLMKDSENKRWMGPRRYDWSGKLLMGFMKQIFGLIVYQMSQSR